MIITDLSAPIQGYAYYLESGSRNRHTVWRYHVVKAAREVMVSRWRYGRAATALAAHNTVLTFAGHVALNLRAKSSTRAIVEPVSTNEKNQGLNAPR